MSFCLSLALRFVFVFLVLLRFRFFCFQWIRDPSFNRPPTCMRPDNHMQLANNCLCPLFYYASRATLVVQYSTVLGTKTRPQSVGVKTCASITISYLPSMRVTCYGYTLNYLVDKYCTSSHEEKMRILSSTVRRQRGHFASSEQSLHKHRCLHGSSTVSLSFSFLGQKENIVFHIYSVTVKGGGQGEGERKVKPVTVFRFRYQRTFREAQNPPTHAQGLHQPI